MKNSLTIFQMVLMALFVGLLVACGGETGQGNVDVDEPMSADATESVEDPMPEGMTLSADITLDPAIVALDDEDSLLVSSMVYEGLMRQLDDGSIAPGIASSCEPSDDELSYLCSLRLDALFRDIDVTPITADVVLENFNRWHDPSHPLHGADSDVYQGWLKYFLGFNGEVDADGEQVSLFDGIEKVDNSTVLIHLFEPMPDFLEVLASPHFSILNTETLKSEGVSYGTMDGSVVSSGPYYVYEWTDTSLTLTPNEIYWGEQPTEEMVYSLE
jgi:ABC-type transport system substrate-binding protein